MSGAVRALLLVLALFIIGIVGWKLTRGSRSAAGDSSRCLDPRQTGCYGVRIQPGKKGSGPPRPETGKQFDVPRADLMETKLALPAPVGELRTSPAAAALRVALSDLARNVPPGTTRRTQQGLPDDPEASLTEYISRTGDVIFRIVSGRSGAVATDYDSGVVYELNRDGTLRRDGALADPGERPARRIQRLGRWGLGHLEAGQLSQNDKAAATFVDLRRTGLPSDEAFALSRQVSGPLPKFTQWRTEHQDEISGLPEGLIAAYYNWLNEVPALSRVLAGALREPPLSVGQRFGFNGGATRRFVEGATSADLSVASKLPRGTIPARLHGGGTSKRTLHELVGDPVLTGTLPLAATTLQRALEQPEDVARTLASLPAGYPYLLLSEEDGDRRRPLVVGAATLLSWAAPVRPGDAESLARLSVLPEEAPVALQAPLSPEQLLALDLKRDMPKGPSTDPIPAGPGDIRLRAFALAGPLRQMLEAERDPVARVRSWFDDPRARPPASYFGNPPFLYATITAAIPGTAGTGTQPAVLARHGIPTGALLHLGAEQADLRAQSGTLPKDAPPRVRGALEELFAAHDHTATTLSRHRSVLGASTAGREMLEKWSAIEGQLAMAGLGSDCVTQHRCPLPGLSREEDAEALFALLRSSIAQVRVKAVLCPLAPAEAAQLTDRLGELLLAADHLASSTEPQRHIHLATRDPALLFRMFAYVQAATAESPRPDGEREGSYLVRDLDQPDYRAHLSAWENGARLPPPAELDGEILRLLRDRGAIPGTLGEWVQRFGDTLQSAPPAYLAAGQAQARADRRVRQRFQWGLSRVSVVQTLDRTSVLRDAEVLVEHPDGTLQGYSYDGDGRLVIKQPPSALPPLGGTACLSCHHDDKGHPRLALPASWQKGAGGVSMLTPVAAAELARTAAKRRASELQP